MDYEKLKAEVKAISEIIELVPEGLRLRCFEILLTHLLAENRTEQRVVPEQREPENYISGGDKRPASISLNGTVRAFIRRTGITQQDLESVVMLEDGTVHFIKEPLHNNLAKGQAEWALLLALRNALLTGTMAVDPEEVRSAVQDKGFYTQANFAANFKQEKYAIYFKGPMNPQGAAQSLSPQGEKALADLIQSFAK